MENQINHSFNNQNEYRNSNKILIKCLIICAIIGLLMIPTFLISNLVTERKERRDQVSKEITEKWGKTQTIHTPVIVIPYYKHFVKKNGTNTEKHLFFYRPALFNAQANIVNEAKHRSIYQMQLYTTQIESQAEFNPISPSSIPAAPNDIAWNEAFAVLNIDDLNGLTSFESSVLNGENVNFLQGSKINDFFTEPLIASVKLSPNTLLKLNVSYNLKGSMELDALPLADHSNIAITSNWKSPSFIGNKLPEPNKNNGHNNTAHWTMSDFAKQPISFKIDGMPNVSSTLLGIKLLEPTNDYNKTDRTIKYAILFISLTFAVFFLLEIISKSSIHPIQYTLVGFALVLFYTLLLSISEYWGFNLAYLCSFISIVGLLTFYINSLVKSRSTTVIFSLGLSSLYAYIFFLVQLEDYALLFGSIGLFVVLALIMIISKKINWYNLNNTSHETIA